ncbi:bifunctional riboflavin kinase/FAD synthetase [Natroniella sulfidigena]|uniref:bifunctional riboflavin kinase/FAD synthetase n=1 Tax=Natroniella sulfidigena TaxID=723921 RepID=UPI00200B2E58|nr:bifunctional riboflavin kinase/FAD synthetase [Natroniella sulfidigena]MCK8816479.1 bifunctional riboflavin kinase/FAD synthetase [Natroniella sulfidigena]
MEIIYNKAHNRPVVMTLGTFDGVHLGHQKIINLTIERAKELGYDSGLFTFHPHPLHTLAPAKAPKRLTSWLQKRKIIESLDIKQIVLQKFTPEFAQITFEKFLVDYLIKRFSVKEIIVGEDFRCGYQSKGTPEQLAFLGSEFGVNVQAIPAVKINQQEAGSTYIRELVEEGRLAQVREQLGRNFVIDCQVVTGEQRGRTLGFPTANLVPVTNYALPPFGVYACKLKHKQQIYDGIVHLGLRPTFNTGQFAIEVHIFDFSQNIYGQRVELEFIERIRGESEFNTEDELVARIEKDIELAKNVLN